MKVIDLPYIHAKRVIIPKIIGKPSYWLKGDHKGWFTEYKKHVYLCQEHGVHPIGFVQFKCVSTGVEYNPKSL